MNSMRRMIRQHSVVGTPAAMVSAALRVGDAAVVVLTGMLAFYWRHGYWDLPERYRFGLLVAALLIIAVFPAFGLYGSLRGRALLWQVRRLLGAGLLVAAMLVGAAYLTKTGALYSRQWAMLWALTAFGGLLALRLTAAATLGSLRRSGWNRKRIGIVGAGSLGRDLARSLQDAVWIGYDVVCFLDDDPECWGKQVCAVPVRPAATIAEIVAKERLDEVWFALPLSAEGRMRSLLHALRHSTVSIGLVPDIFTFRLLNHAVREVAGYPLLDLTSSPMTGFNRMLKALEDRLLAALILILISPLMLLIALGIKLGSPGPILFKQRRHGWDGRVIQVWKFRSMKLHEEPPGSVTQATMGDPRLTRIGTLLRQTSLDELPQLFNVLCGDMSLVGPRPHAIEHNEKYSHLIDGYMLRHKVKPGITGWAQIHGYRGRTDTVEKMEKRVEYDLFYIEHWSLWLDLKIIVMTLFKGFLHKNAY